MEKVVITTFTDPMMGLSWECEPLFRKLETHFAGQIEFRTLMSLLVRDVRDFMLPSELALGKPEGIRRYNARLAKIYKSEEPIAGMPINMEGFCLFDEAHTTSYPLNLAYKAAELTAPEKSAQFLYDLRYATVVDTRPTTHDEEILAVVRKAGIDENCFLRHWQDGNRRNRDDAPTGGCQLVCRMGHIGSPFLKHRPYAKRHTGAEPGGPLICSERIAGFFRIRFNQSRSARSGSCASTPAP